MVVLVIQVKNTVLLSLRVLNLKKSTAGAFVVPFRGLSREKTKWQQITCCFRIVTPDLTDDTNFKTSCPYSNNTSEPRHFCFKSFILTIAITPSFLQLFRQRLSHNSTKVHATMPIGIMGSYSLAPLG